MAQTAYKEASICFDNLMSEPADVHKEIITGLSGSQKTLNPKFFYDTRGSELFEKITRLAEYYPTRTERKILRDYAPEIADVTGQGAIVIEPGSGSSEKIQLLLPSLRPKCYVPIDIADDFLYESASNLKRVFPWLAVHALCADFSRLSELPDNIPAGDRMVFYPGSTLGNMSPEEAVSFLSVLWQWLDGCGGMLIGIDLHKDVHILNAAYNDSAGVTAEFNLNILHHLNNAQGGNFDLNNFTHHAFFNEQQSRIEMHLVSDKRQQVSVAGENFLLQQGESIHTENSYKYKPETFAELAASAGFNIEQFWTDEQGWFGVFYLVAAGTPLNSADLV